MKPFMPSRKRKGSKVSGGFCTSKRIKSGGAVKDAEDYLEDKDHEDHKDCTLDPKENWLVPEGKTFTEIVNEVYQEFQDVRDDLKSHRDEDVELAIHVIFPFPEGTRFEGERGKKEKRLFRNETLSSISSRSPAVTAWHEGKNGEKPHMHALICGFSTKGVYPRLTEHLIREQSELHELLGTIELHARRAVEKVNEGRRERDEPEIPTYTQAKAAKRDKENATRKAEGKAPRNWIFEFLAQEFRFWPPDDEKELRKKLKELLEKQEWEVVKRAKTRGGMKCVVVDGEKEIAAAFAEDKENVAVLPKGSDRKTPFYLDFHNIRVMTRRMKLERCRSFKGYDAVLEDATERLGPSLESTEQLDSKVVVEALKESGCARVQAVSDRVEFQTSSRKLPVSVPMSVFEKEIEKRFERRLDVDLKAFLHDNTCLRLANEVVEQDRIGGEASTKGMLVNRCLETARERELISFRGNKAFTILKDGEGNARMLRSECLLDSLEKAIGKAREKRRLEAPPFDYSGFYVELGSQLGEEDYKVNQLFEIVSQVCESRGLHCRRSPLDSVFIWDGFEFREEFVLSELAMDARAEFDESRGLALEPLVPLDESEETRVERDRTKDEDDEDIGRSFVP